MHACWLRRPVALTAAFVLLTPGVRADLVTPDSIPNPPSAVDPASGTSVYSNNLIGMQYAGLGLRFPGDSAITHLNGVSVWVPISTFVIPAVVSTSGPPLNIAYGAISYYGSWSGGVFVSPGSQNPAFVSSLSVEIIGHPLLSMSVYGLNGQPLNIVPTVSSTSGSQVRTFKGSSIYSFTAFAAVIDPPGVGAPAVALDPSWGVASVAFTPSTAPEPGTLLLAGLGVLGLAAPASWRRATARLSKRATTNSEGLPGGVGRARMPF